MQNDQVKVVAFVGMPGAGKGSCAEYLAKKYAWPVVHFGNMFYEELQKQGLDNVKDENKFHAELREQQGPAVLAKLATKRAEELAKGGTNRIVFDGLYSWSEYKYLREVFDHSLLVIAIAAPRLERYRRILGRQDAHRKYTDVEQIKNREISEIENIEKGGPIALADYTIVNDGTTEQMLAQLNKILDKAHFYA